MKHKSIVLICLFLINGFSLLAQAMLYCGDTKKNFGIVKQGKEVKIPFLITNKGNLPLLIDSVKAECSCTKVTWPQKPVLPAQSDSVIVYFNTTHTYDRQDRIVEIISNASNSPSKLRFKGVVLRQ